MRRIEFISRLEEDTEWDIVIIGGGATGLGAAVDASSRGYKTLLLERYDFAKGTSSRSTKLVHGGVRYLEQGNIKLVMEALRERGLLLKNAPHLTRTQPFIIPVYSWWKKWYYGIGLKIYDLMSRRLSLGKTAIISAKAVQEFTPAVSLNGLSGGVLYYDGQFDDARLAFNLAQTAADNGGVVLNYMKVTGLKKVDQKCRGVFAEDSLTGQTYTIRSKAVINATGVFTDDILKMDDHLQHHIVSPSQGVHLVVDRQFFPGEYAMMIPKTDDGRVLFAVPWHQEVIIGTTDTPVSRISFEPRPLEEEMEFIFRNINQYLSSGISKQDVKAVFTGLRPLVKFPGKKNTAVMPRDHTVIVSPSNLVTITGGKWTTYRKMAKVAVDNALFVGKLVKRSCITESLALHGSCEVTDQNDPLSYYGADAPAVRKLTEENEAWKEKLHPDLPYIRAQVVWAVRYEMALTVEDALARRIRMLFLNARAAMECAPEVAEMMAKELGRDETWKQEQVNEFTEIAKGYLPEKK